MGQYFALTDLVGVVDSLPVSAGHLKVQAYTLILQFSQPRFRAPQLVVVVLPTL